MNSTLRSWVLTDGKQGMESQCLGLTDALDMKPDILRIAPRFPWSVLPPQLWAAPLSAPGPDGDTLTPPWPDLLISTGRQTVAPVLAIKKIQQDRIVVIQLQNPTVDPARFDLVISPSHDGLTGANVVATLGALHRVTPTRLQIEAARFAGRYAALPRPMVAVLLGGDNRHFSMTPKSAYRLGSLLAQVAEKHGAGLAITASRRTGTANLERIGRALEGYHVDIWNGDGDNPYFGMLGLADAIVVTGDSVNMVSEACATGKPVHVSHLDGASGKFGRFHAALEAQGITRPFEGRLENWRYTPPNDVTRAAMAVRKLLVC
ncbi:mitochondrial fission ELM1 family protein [Alphaproteobacteria bacterium]|nr:mitochondrial fission ELM1 family protein [Alphaproteobacteria bacterium]